MTHAVRTILVVLGISRENRMRRFSLVSFIKNKKVTAIIDCISFHFTMQQVLCHLFTLHQITELISNHNFFGFQVNFQRLHFGFHFFSETLFLHTFMSYLKFFGLVGQLKCSTSDTDNPGIFSTFLLRATPSSQSRTAQSTSRVASFLSLRSSLPGQ